jgi:hypothetical protein
MTEHEHFLAWVREASPYIKRVSAATGTLSALGSSKDHGAICDAAGDLIYEIDATARCVSQPEDPNAVRWWNEWLTLMRASGEATIRAVKTTHDLGQAGRLSREATKRMHELVEMTKER